MGKEYSKQHVVPRCYLNRFARKKNKDEYIIGVLYKDGKGKRKCFKENTSKVGFVRDLYDVCDKDDEKYWEHYFANTVDAMCGKELDNILSSMLLAGPNYKLSEKYKKVFSTIMVAQIFRVPANIKYFSEQVFPKSLISAKNDVISRYKLEDNEYYKSRVNAFTYSEVQKKQLYMNLIFDDNNNERFIHMLEKRTWIAYINLLSDEMPFVTNDNPVLIERWDQQTSPGVFNNSLNGLNTFMYFPLSPRVAIANYPEDGVFASMFEPFADKVIAIDDGKYILNRNITMTEQCYKNTYLPDVLYRIIE